MTLDELLAGINELATDDDKAKELADAIRAKAKPVAQVLLNAGAAMQKGEAKKESKRIEQERDEWKEKAETLETEFSEFKTRTPNAKEIEDRLNEKWDKKLKAKDAEIATKDQTLRSTLQRGGLTKFSRELIKLGVDPDYAQAVATEKHRDRLSPKDDGTLGVLQIGSTLEYDGDDEDQRIAALAADVRKTVPPKFVNTNADSGAGVRNGGGGSVRQSEEQLAAEMRASGRWGSAF